MMKGGDIVSANETPWGAILAALGAGAGFSLLHFSPISPTLSFRFPKCVKIRVFFRIDALKLFRKKGKKRRDTCGR